MTLNKLMSELRKLQKQGYGKLTVEIFAHDHDYHDDEQGDGVARYADHIETHSGKEIIAIRP